MGVSWLLDAHSAKAAAFITPLHKLPEHFSAERSAPLSGEKTTAERHKPGEPMNAVVEEAPRTYCFVNAVPERVGQSVHPAFTVQRM